MFSWSFCHSNENKYYVGLVPLYIHSLQLTIAIQLVLRQYIVPCREQMEWYVANPIESVFQ